ncbi:hypothetical protein GCM10011384_33710 [Psychrobacillus lasiicapitis]|nr:hypothetical protein GCM10011384_33710 [Psychrobacillus lasiicapitis]
MEINEILFSSTRKGDFLTGIIQLVNREHSYLCTVWGQLVHKFGIFYILCLIYTQLCGKVTLKSVDNVYKSVDMLVLLVFSCE